MVGEKQEVQTDLVATSARKAPRFCILSPAGLNKPHCRDRDVTSRVPIRSRLTAAEGLAVGANGASFARGAEASAVLAVRDVSAVASYGRCANKSMKGDVRALGNTS